MSPAAILSGVAAFFGLAAMSQTQAASDLADRLLEGFADLPTPRESANLRAFLAVIRSGEGTADAAGYRRLFGGALVDSLADHPRQKVTRSMGGQMLTSSAAGAYQFLERTWDECAESLGLQDFGPESQDRAAVFLIRRRGALGDVLAGRFAEAVRKCAKEWASLPGSPYGQPTRSMEQARAAYKSAGGVYA